MDGARSFRAAVVIRLARNVKERRRSRPGPDAEGVEKQKLCSQWRTELSLVFKCGGGRTRDQGKTARRTVRKYLAAGAVGTAWRRFVLCHLVPSNDEAARMGRPGFRARTGRRFHHRGHGGSARRSRFGRRGHPGSVQSATESGLERIGDFSQRLSLLTRSLPIH